MDIEVVTEITDELLHSLQRIHAISREELDLRDGDIFLLAKVSDLLVGYAHARTSISHILAIYVVSNERRGKEKVGGTLLEGAISHLKNQGAKEIRAGIEPTNKGVLGFYEKYGFTISNIGKTGFISVVKNIN